MSPTGESLAHQRDSGRAAQPARERRRHARIRQLSLESSLGPVLDLSRSGMRVQTHRRIRGEIDVVIFNRCGPPLQLRARVVWTKRSGFRRHVAGLQFVDPPQHVARALTEIGTASFDV
jgi:hypothetical protein